MLFSEKARKRRLEAANGVAIPEHWPRFRAAIWNFSRLFMIVFVEGEENIPAPEGEIRGVEYMPPSYERMSRLAHDSHGYAFVANHESSLDIPALGVFKRPFAIIGKPPFAMWPGLSHYFFRMGLVPVFRPGRDSRGSKFMQAYRQAMSYKPAEMYEVAVRALERGHAVYIWATGSRKSTETKKGTFIIARRSGCPVVPVAIYGTAKGEAIRVGLLRRRLVVVKVGTPIDCGHQPEGDIDDELLKADMEKWEYVIHEELLPAARRTLGNLRAMYWF